LPTDSNIALVTVLSDEHARHPMRLDCVKTQLGLFSTAGIHGLTHVTVINNISPMTGRRIGWLLLHNVVERIFFLDSDLIVEPKLLIEMASCEKDACNCKFPLKYYERSSEEPPSRMFYLGCSAFKTSKPIKNLSTWRSPHKVYGNHGCNCVGIYSELHDKGIGFTTFESKVIHL